MSIPASTERTPRTSRASRKSEPPLSLYRLLDPQVLADPYPLYERLRREDPVHWDPFLHAWVVTRYADVVQVLYTFSANRAFTPEQMTSMGLEGIAPIAKMMLQQMLFMDAGAHARLRSLCASAFTPQRVEGLRSHIEEIAEQLLDGVAASGSMELIRDFAAPFPAIVTAEMLGLPIKDHVRMKDWSATFAEMLGNFQHNPDRIRPVLQTIDEMTEYFRNAVEEQRKAPRPGLLSALLSAEVNGDRLTDDEVIANSILTMVGGQETTTNLIANGILTLLKNRTEMQRLKADPTMIQSAVEELLRYESPSQFTARIAPNDVEMGGKVIRKKQAVLAVMGAANRDPEKFADPDRLDLSRKDNRHVAFGWGPHFCFGAPLARIEAQIAFNAILRRLTDLQVTGPVVWRENLGLRGLTELQVAFKPAAASS